MTNKEIKPDILNCQIIENNQLSSYNISVRVVKYFNNVELTMNINTALSITEQEKGHLLEMLEANHKDLLHELHHTDTADYKEMLREKIRVVESLQSKLTELTTA